MKKKSLSLILPFIAMILTTPVSADPGHEQHAHHHHFNQDVESFHAVLAPLWHSRPGKERTVNVCAKANQLETLAKDIHSADAKPMLAKLAILKQKCKTNRNDVDAAFFDVHEAFHQLIDHKH